MPALPAGRSPNSLCSVCYNTHQLLSLLCRYYMSTSMMTICFTLIKMCFPFSNGTNIFNLPDVEHTVIKNNSQAIVGRSLFNGGTGKCHGSDQWGNLVSAQTASSRWWPSRERFYNPLYHECREHVDSSHYTQWIKEAQEDKVGERKGRMVEGGGEWGSEREPHTVPFCNQSSGFQHY